MINARVAVNATRPIGAVHPHIYGHFIEHLRDCIYNGLWAEMLQNRKFGGHDVLYYGIVLPWLPVGPGPAVRYMHDNRIFYVPGMAEGRGQAQRFQVEQTDGRPHGIAQDGLALRAGRRYQGRLVLRAEGLTGPVEVSLGGEHGPADRHVIAGVGPEWQTYTFVLTAPRDDDRGRFSITVRDAGALWVGCASLMPDDHFHGWRRDVLELVRGLKPPIVRYPGGNFVSGYRWQDGIGERDRRPVRFDHAWNVYEPNDVGTDDFMIWARELGTEPYLCVNMGDGTPEEAAAWVEYCNGPADSRYGALRAQNGHPEPYDIIYWGVGNECYGNWQIGHVDAETYAHEVVAFARAMRAVDPRLKLLAVGGMPDRWPDWNAALARIAGAEIDYITLHHYARDNADTPPDESYAMTVSAPDRIADLIARSRRDIDANAPAGKFIPISFDEWNVAHRRLHAGGEESRNPAAVTTPAVDISIISMTEPRLLALAGSESFALAAPDTTAGPIADEPRSPGETDDEPGADYEAGRWQRFLNSLSSYATTRGPGRQNYALADGLYAASFFNVMLRNADHITMANQAQLVNLLGLIETSPTDCYGTPQYLAFQLYVDHAGAQALPVEVESPTFDVPRVSTMPARQGVAYLDVAASYDPEGKRLFLHVVNRHPSEPAEVEIELSGLTAGGTTTAHELNGPHVWARNTFADHERVGIQSRPGGPAAGRLRHQFAPHSATSLEIPCA